MSPFLGILHSYCQFLLKATFSDIRPRELSFEFKIFHLAIKLLSNLSKIAVSPTC